MVTVVVEVEERWECDCKKLGKAEEIDRHILDQWNGDCTPKRKNACWGRTLVGSLAWYSVHA